MFDREMRQALQADAEKLSQLTGERHEVEFWDTCPACDGYGSHEQHRPQHDDPYFCVVITCTDCGGSGWQQLDEPAVQHCPQETAADNG